MKDNYVITQFYKCPVSFAMKVIILRRVFCDKTYFVYVNEYIQFYFSEIPFAVIYI